MVILVIVQKKLKLERHKPEYGEVYQRVILVMLRKKVAMSQKASANKRMVVPNKGPKS